MIRQAPGTQPPDPPGPEADWPAAAAVANEAGASDWLLVCEHASRHIPAEYGRLGLPPGAERAHIGWDIGAAALTRALAARMDAAAVTARYSRLLIDLNRPTGAPSSIPVRSEATDIPGNLDLDPRERARRVARIFDPFHAELRRVLDARAAAGRRTRLLTVHSFTPVFLGRARPWHLGVLSGASRALAARLLEAVGAESPDLCLALDEPYVVDDASDYAIPVHGDGRGLDALLIEVRNDLLRGDDDVMLWAERLSRALARL
ncbi:MAG: N-formylglutamate amidohydrolase [Pikeienuella sp.]